MLLGDPRQSHQRTQSFHFPIVVHQSLDPAAQSSAQAPSTLSLHALRSSSARQAQNASTRWSTRRRGNHMHDHSRFQRDINDVTGVSLSLSLSLSQKSLTHNIGSASALPIIHCFLVCVQRDATKYDSHFFFSKIDQRFFKTKRKNKRCVFPIRCQSTSVLYQTPWPPHSRISA